ncbi:MAG: alpha-glucosidase/alpha-galactosidase [Armatimonadetes bacterium]|nr:alpha-glucosidase/alpha-galactosidase [Armatimonadota bacterium]
MGRKINVTMMGAGSFFTASVLKDVLLIPGNLGGELRLVDVDGERLELSRQLMLKILEATDQAERWTVRASLDRRELLPGSDYLINSIEVSGVECVRFDNDIPLEFGVSQNIGDTMGPGGLMKGLRTIPVWLDILRDAEELCPQVVVLNYTNPMSMLMLAASRVSRLPNIGLCHSVQGTSAMLARYSGVPIEDIRWDCAGINHLAWFTRWETKGGKDLYPVLMAQANDRSSEFAKAEPVRSDMMRHFGAFITESSGHLSEYLPYYRKRKDLLDKYTDTGYRGEESFYANNWPNWRKGQDENRRRLISGEDKVTTQRTWEYGSWIIEAIEKNQPFVVHGNVTNHGLITNLPQDGCVEVACLIDRRGIQPTVYGRLPKQMAAICASNMQFFDLAADAAIQRSRHLAKLALLMDPLTAAVCSPEEVFQMVDRLFEAEEAFLPGYSRN